MKKRERKYRMHQVSIDQEESRWKCETCPAPIENEDSRWCIHCRMYWEDCRKGLFDECYEHHLYSARNYPL
jgi:hypothetical protein